jgi:hypothetical protein
MLRIEKINEGAENDAENALASLGKKIKFSALSHISCLYRINSLIPGLRFKGKEKFNFPQDLNQQLNPTNAKKKKIVPSTAGPYPRNSYDSTLLDESDDCEAQNPLPSRILHFRPYCLLSQVRGRLFARKSQQHIYQNRFF